jgi:hypothetical protein
MYHVALLQQQLRQIGAILAGDAGDEGAFHRGAGCDITINAQMRDFEQNGAA